MIAVIFRGLLPGLGCIALLAGTAQGAGMGGPFAFRLAPPVVSGQGEVLATLTLEIPAGHHLYREQTALTLSRGDLQIAWPPSHEKPDPFTKQPVQVFDGTNTVFLRLRATEAGPATLTLSYQGCSAKACFMPSEEVFAFDLPGFAGNPDDPGGARVVDPAGSRGDWQPLSRPASGGSGTDAGSAVGTHVGAMTGSVVETTAGTDSGSTPVMTGTPGGSGSTETGNAPGSQGSPDSTGAIGSPGSPEATGSPNSAGSPGSAESPGSADFPATTGTGSGSPAAASGQAATADSPSLTPTASPSTNLVGPFPTNRSAAASPGPTVAATSPSASAAGPDAAGPVQTPGGVTDFGRLVRERGVFWALLAAFVGGLLVSLTPCVYPMIPITLSIIGGRKENTSVGRGLMLSLTYVAGLSLTYALLGLLVASFGAHIRGFLQGAFFQLLMAGIFLLLSFSMFDLFMLQAPSFMRERLSGVHAGGPGGIFFLGMVSGLMASPCVAAPLAGILAFIAASGSLFMGFFMLLAFAWGMGILLVVIGAFSGSLNALPRAGEWMNRVKEFYGFLLAGAAVYFASPVLGAPWASLLVGLLLAAFATFLGLFQPVTAETTLGERILKAWGVVTLVVGCAFAVSAAGKWGGLCFPGGGAPGGERIVTAGLPAPIWHDRMADALQVAKRDNTSIFVDFRADWCAICREIEENVFPQPQVQDLLRTYTLLKVDVTRNEGEPAELMKRFGVIGLPTFVILDTQGAERPDLRLVGGGDAAVILDLLRRGRRN